MVSHANFLNEAYRVVMKSVGQFSSDVDRICAYAKMVKLYGGFLFASYYPVLLARGFSDMSKKPHVPHGEDLPQLTDYEWGKIKKDLAHNVEMAKKAQFDKDVEDVRV